MSANSEQPDLQPPTPLMGLSDDAFGILVIRNPKPWLDWANANFKLTGKLKHPLGEVNARAADLEDQLDEFNRERRRTTEALPSPDPSEPSSDANADSDTAAPTLCREQSFYVSGIGIGHVQQLVIIPRDGSRPAAFKGSFGYSIQQWVNTKATVDHVTVSYVERVPDYGMLSDQEQEVEANLEGTLGRRTAQKEQTQTRIKREDPDTGGSCIAKIDEADYFDIVVDNKPKSCSIHMLTRIVPFEGGILPDANGEPITQVLQTHTGFFALPDLKAPSADQQLVDLVFGQESVIVRPVNLGKSMIVNMWLKALDPADIRYAVSIEEQPGVFQDGVDRSAGQGFVPHSGGGDDDEQGGPPSTPKPSKKRKRGPQKKKRDGTLRFRTIQNGVLLRTPNSASSSHDGNEGDDGDNGSNGHGRPSSIGRPAGRGHGRGRGRVGSLRRGVSSTST